MHRYGNARPWTTVDLHTVYRQNALLHNIGYQLPYFDPRCSKGGGRGGAFAPVYIGKWHPNGTRFYPFAQPCNQETYDALDFEKAEEVYNMPTLQSTANWERYNRGRATRTRPLQTEGFRDQVREAASLGMSVNRMTAHEAEPGTSPRRRGRYWRGKP